RPPDAQPRPQPARAVARPRPQRAAWVVAIALVMAVLALAWAATRAPISEAAGNPLYLHGGGTAPNCTGGTIDQTAGTKSPACAIQSTSGGVTTVFAFSNLPAQTIPARVWIFLINGTGSTGNMLDTDFTTGRVATQD